MRRIFVFLTIFLWVAARAEEVPITILHTTDIHAHVWPVTDYEGNKDVGGCARLATAVAKIRAEMPHTLLVDAGDTIQGGPIGFLTEGQVMIKYLNYMKYDAWVLGNHEFDWGSWKLNACLVKTMVPIVTANVQRVGDDQSRMGFRRLEPYRLVEIKGVKVAIIGLTTPGIPNWSRPRLIAGLRFESPVDALKRVIPEVKAKGAQVIILVTHQGSKDRGDDHANQLNAVTREFPEIDAIVGGHTHQVVAEFKLNGVLYSQAGYWGIRLGRMDLVYDTVKKKVTSRKATVIPMDASVEFDKNFLHEISAELDLTKKEMGRVIGTAADEISAQGGSNHETPMHDLLCVSMATSLKAKGTPVAAVFHGLLDKSSLAKGEITVGDVWRIVPYENTLGVAQLLPSELQEILEEDATLWERKEFRGLWGMKVKIKSSAPKGQRILSLTDREGKPLNPNQRIPVAFVSFDLASAGTRLKKLREICDRPTSKLQEFDLQTRQAVIDYISAQKTLAPENGGWWKTSQEK